MFTGATSFNQPICSWITSQVTNMSLMFSGATSFNQPIDNLDVPSVTDMSFMFIYAAAFNKNIRAWTVDLDNTNVAAMFEGATVMINTYSIQNGSDDLPLIDSNTGEPSVFFFNLQ